MQNSSLPHFKAIVFGSMQGFRYLKLYVLFLYKRHTNKQRKKPGTYDFAREYVNI